MYRRSRGNVPVNGEEAASCRAFTLIELLVGIAVSSILLMGLFQLLSDLTQLKAGYREQSLSTHERVALRRLLYQDLYSLPSGKPEFDPGRGEFSRTTVAHSADRGLIMETRVHYFTRRDGDNLKLLREWKWVDLHDSYRETEVLYSGETIQFNYMTESGDVVRRPGGRRKDLSGVQIETDEFTVTVPLATKSTDESNEESQGTRRGPGQ